ncbi:ArsR/SmtB family transcription factor [Mammaliicoccus sciuri]|jgi:DNA-binding transcriptional ArsR family regulator|uniref:ArsR family transcriptional regulator n=1 Tax=Mammaliicoccus sciuri TaxID=1296 RepID=A0AAJ4VIN0_MAMSC|nr:metalloregulator ArsR/SmtB family transcription factor [Mammaliicoccus sciuri]MBF0773782.1 winged helix-turn-helix transcriptional regulator [Mammaliicoccus sciuri]MBG9204479.1 winged helix-turn-helix transcriptional regulator [Mammaliicoccus sciuri]MBG9211557.1 winged helix-turn-helix transcriptional regulator [Mammaliicoccus sciuri]MBU6089549.1 metalloregulator ArsR/SmtB family transcription factor [Mammaliicoccus sciuri]MBW3109494.1 metalloregulator ArsR/SmtB family transcription factor 
MNDIELKAHFIHGLSNKTRLTILELLKLKEMTVNEIVEQSKISQSSISQHLACLKGCGLVISRQEGKFVYYQIKNDQILALLQLIDSVVEDTEEDIACCQHHTI